MTNSILTKAAAILCVLASTIGCGSPTGTDPDEDQGLIEVHFHDRTPLDEPANHLTLLYREPREALVLPEGVDTAEAWFFDVFYSRTNTEEYTISAMMVPSQDSDIFFVDLNNDEDLTNDGDPRVMAKTDEGITFEIVATDDRRQRTVYRLNRAPTWFKEEHQQEVHDAFFDKDGNLPPECGPFFSVGRTGYATQSGLFFFDRRVGLARGQLIVGEERVAIGIFDFDNNGIFDDPDDLLVIDLDRDGLLTVLFSVEGYALDDPFLIDDTWFRLVESDRYGESAVFEKVDAPAEAAYWLDSESDFTGDQGDRIEGANLELVNSETSRPGVKGARLGSLNPQFWETEFEGTDSAVLRAEDYRGRFLLLNFWGEWCAPCIAEIPDLIEAHSRYSPKGLRIISFLESPSPDNAAKILAKHGANWPQVILTDELKKRFRIGAFPTNLLILPDGTTYLRTGTVNEVFFETFVEEGELFGSE